MGVLIPKFVGLGLQDGIESVDDVSGKPYWFWETRSLANIIEGLKAKASASRLKHKQWRERMNSISGVLKLIEDESKSRGKNFHNRLNAAMEKLNKIPSFNAIQDELHPEESSESIKRVRKRVKREGEPATLPSCDKDQYRETKLVSVPGFGSLKSLKKSQNFFKSFLGTPSKESKPMSEFTLGGHIVVTCPLEKRVTYENGDIAYMDSQLLKTKTKEEIIQFFLETCQKYHVHPNYQKRAVYGAPAAWSRKPGLEFNLKEAFEAKYGPDWYEDELTIIRKKYLWFISDSDCPPFFGAFPTVEGVSARNPFKKVEDLNYDDLFDEGWEQEPEGESLSIDEEEKDDKDSETDEDDPFIVADGYLSEDEGIEAEMELEEDSSQTSETPCVETQSRPEILEKETKIKSLLNKALKFGQVSVVTTLKTKHKVETVTLLSALQGFRLGKGKITIQNKK